MLKHLFIGAIIAWIMVHFGILTGILAAIIIAVFSRPTPKKINIPNQEKLLENILSLKVEKYSDKIIGTFNNNDIHEYLVLKNLAKGICTKYEYHDIIHYNGLGQITTSPKVGEVFTATGLIFKDTGVEYK